MSALERSLACGTPPDMQNTEQRVYHPASRALKQQHEHRLPKTNRAAPPGRFRQRASFVPRRRRCRTRTHSSSYDARSVPLSPYHHPTTIPHLIATRHPHNSPISVCSALSSQQRNKTVVPAGRSTTHTAPPPPRCVSPSPPAAFRGCSAPDPSRSWMRRRRAARISASGRPPRTATSSWRRAAQA